MINQQIYFITIQFSSYEFISKHFSPIQFIFQFLGCTCSRCFFASYETVCWYIYYNEDLTAMTANRKLQNN